MEFDPKGVFLFRPDGETRQNEFSTQLDDLGQTGVLRCLENPTQNGGMKPTSWNSITRVFFRFVSWPDKKNSRGFKSCHHFGWAFPSSGKSRVDEGRPIAFKTRFFNFSHLGQTKKTAVRSNFTISVSCHHFVWAFPSSAKRWGYEGRRIPLKTLFF